MLIEKDNQFLDIKKCGHVAFTDDEKKWVFGQAEEFDGKWKIKPIVTYYDTGDQVFEVINNNKYYILDKDDYKYVYWLGKNPFKSPAQRKFMFWKHPRIAARWEKKGKKK